MSAMYFDSDFQTAYTKALRNITYGGVIDMPSSIPNPKLWEEEALREFQRSGKSAKDWPRFRDQYIVKQATILADRHQARALKDRH